MPPLLPQPPLPAPGPVATRRPRGRRAGLIRAALPVAVLVLVAALGPSLLPHDAYATDLDRVLAPPSLAHPFGTDSLGRDVLSRVVAAARLDLAIAAAAVALSAPLGTLVGAFAGLAGGWGDRILSRLADVAMAFPMFIGAMALVAVFGNSAGAIVLATAVVNLPFYFRLMRAETAQRRHAGYVEAAVIGGTGPLRLLWRILIPNALPPVIVQASLNLGWAVLNTAGLAFLGLGVAPPTPEWGLMIQAGAAVTVTGQWWVAGFPGLALVLAVFAFTRLGDGLRDALDPRLSG